MTSTAYRTIPGADRTFSSVSLYFQVARLMVKVHQISPQLAAYHAFQMDEAELNRRLRMYAEMELSVVDPNPTAVNESSTRFSRPQRRRQVDGTQLHSRKRRCDLKLKVGYDGDSRPILLSDDSPPRMFSISEFIDGRWQSFDGEDPFCEVIAEAVSGFKLQCSAGHLQEFALPRR